MKIVVMGLHGDADEDSVGKLLAPYFSVTKVTMIRDGAKDRPWALAEVKESYYYVWTICRRLTGMFHRGGRLRFYIPLHQAD